MQSSSGMNTTFRLTWKIHNFTMIPYKAGEPLWSPTIVIDIFDGTEWNLGLYVRGYKRENYVTGCVYRGKSEEGNDTIPIHFTVSFKNVDGSSALMYEKNYDFARNNGHGFQLVSQNEIFQNKKFLFPGDTLIMEFRMRKTNVEDKITLQSCVRNCAFDTKFATAVEVMKKALQPSAAECEIRTRVNVEELKFIWAIPRFCTVKPGQKLSVPIYFAGKHSPNFVLSLKPNMSSKIPEENMHIELKAENGESFYCTYEILLVDCDHVSRIHMKGEHLFEIGTPMSCNVQNSLKWSELQRNKHLHLVDETLTLDLKFAVAYPSSVTSFIEKTIYSLPKLGVVSLNSDCADEKKPNDPRMRHNKLRKFSDVSLRVEKKLLQTHKIILCTWSSVFKTILEQDLNEDCSILDIDDIDSETIDRMLIFMYTRTVEDLGWKETTKLYLAAYKYRIIQLQDKCSTMLKSKISLSNVCEILSLADMHKNEELIKFATSFIKEHKDEVFRTVEWKNMMENKGELAAKLMHGIFVKD